MTETSWLLRVSDVVAETGDACSIVFEVPDEAGDAFAYRPGQFLTLAVPSDLTGVVARSYSLSSSPDWGGPPTVTVKRTVDGYASNWICDNLHAGDTVRVLPPGGIFTPRSLDADFLLFAGGSGVTPIISIARSALKAGSGRVVVLYANRDERSVIFADEWSELARAYPDRLQVVHWLESVQGLPTQEQLRAFAAQYLAFDAFVCGPAPFMALVTAALKELRFPRERRHQEKFISLGGNPFTDATSGGGPIEAGVTVEATSVPQQSQEQQSVRPAERAVLEVELDGEDYAFDDWDPRVPLLEFLESKGVRAPYSCREGECSACAFRLLEGEVAMRHNDVLDDEDLADGIRLGCQSLPITEKLRITYS
jgi:3-ketosteroid 9alpha-monooxygenase subunit B